MTSPALTQPLPLSGVVITKNEADRIGRCVSSLCEICAEVIVVDSDSTDGTEEVARQAGAIVLQHEWPGFAHQKNWAIAQASQPWILLLDADEWLGARAPDILRRLYDSGDIERADIWQLQRRTHFLGRPLHFGGWGAEGVMRLFRSDVRYLPDMVHERLSTSGKTVARAAVRIEHDTARSQTEYRSKLVRYAQLWAEQRAGEGRRAGILDAPIHALSYILKHVLIRGGLLDGPQAWRYHLIHTNYVYLKYRTLRVLSTPGKVRRSQGLGVGG